MYMLLLLIFVFQANALDNNLIDDGGIVTLSLQNYSNAHQNDYSTVKLTNNASLTIFVNDIPNYIHFVVLQVHSFNYPVNLRYTKEITNINNVNGTNIGLVKFAEGSQLIFYLTNHHDMKISALIAVVGYTADNPIPGGCAMEAPTGIAPYLDLTYSDTIISVGGGPSSSPKNGAVCDPRSGIKYTFYQLFLPEWDFSEDTYFSNILKMMTFKNDIYSSLEGIQSFTGKPFQKTFSSYPGLGRVITLVATSPNGGFSVYVPTITYSCNTTYNSDDCTLPMSTFMVIGTAAILPFVGLFICLKGHRYFLVNLFIMGSLAGTFVSYILLQLCFSEEIGEMDFGWVSTAIGMVFGIAWTSTWWCLHRPMLSILISFLNLSCLVAILLMSFLRDAFPTFSSNTAIYWAIFFSVVIVLLFICIAKPVNSHIAAACIIGAYMTGLSTSIYFGSILIYYTFINFIRLATIDGFNQANTETPYQVPDVMFSVLIILMVGFGRWRQNKDAEGRPPFPPISTLFRPEAEETSSLLSESDYPTYVTVRRTIIVVQE